MHKGHEGYFHCVLRAYLRRGEVCADDRAAGHRG